MQIGYRSAVGMLWAKTNPFHPLWMHLTDTAAMCEALLPYMGPVPGVSNSLVCYVVALHDIGKADRHFQARHEQSCQNLQRAGIPMDKVSAVGQFRHEMRSGEWLRNHLNQPGLVADELARDEMCRAIELHHGDAGAPTPYCEDEYEEITRHWNQLRDELAAGLYEVLQPEKYAPEHAVNPSALCMRIAGITVMADWLASNQSLYDYPHLGEKYREATIQDYYQHAKRLAVETVKDLFPLMPLTAVPSFSDCFGFPARPIQDVVVRACDDGVQPGLAILEAPTGEGKTEAALYLAWHWNQLRGSTGGVYFALPTQAAGNQIFDRYKEILKNRGMTDREPHLIHGMAWLVDRDFGQPQISEDEEHNGSAAATAGTWFMNAKRALLAVEGVGTIDQALMAALKVRFVQLRLLGLSNKTLILDEVHACETFMMTILQRLLQWCRALEIPVILLSATLSHKQKLDLIGAWNNNSSEPAAMKDVHLSDEYPLLTCISAGQAAQCFTLPTGAPRVPKSISIVPHYGTYGCTAEPGQIHPAAKIALDVADTDGCVCVLVNSVNDAQSIYRQLVNSGTDAKVCLFHARFPAWRRTELENQVTELFGKQGDKRPKKAILVATQVVEQSLDVDFDVMITQLAPVDLLLQRAGRLWRHARSERPVSKPVLHLLLPRIECPQADRLVSYVGTGIYEAEWMLRTLESVHSLEHLHLPHDYRSLIHQVYDEQTTSSLFPTVMDIAKKQRLQKEAKDAAKPMRYMLVAPREDGLTWRDSYEEQGGTGDFIHISTRLNDTKRATVLVLAEPDAQQALDRCQSLTIKDVQKFMQWKVDIPKHWLDGCTLPTRSDHRLLRNVQVLSFKDGRFMTTGDNEPNTIHFCPDLGLWLTKAGEQESEIWQ